MSRGVPTFLIFVCGNEVEGYYGTMNEDDLRKTPANEIRVPEGLGERHVFQEIIYY